MLYIYDRSAIVVRYFSQLIMSEAFFTDYVITFGPPPPLVHIQQTIHTVNPCNLPYFVRITVTPLPPLSADVI